MLQTILVALGLAQPLPPPVYLLTGTQQGPRIERMPDIESCQYTVRMIKSDRQLWGHIITADCLGGDH